MAGDPLSEDPLSDDEPQPISAKAAHAEMIKMVSDFTVVSCMRATLTLRILARADPAVLTQSG